MSLLENNTNINKDKKLDKPLYLVNPITLDVFKYSVDEILNLLKTLKGNNSLEYIDSIASNNGFCKTLKAHIFKNEPSLKERKSLIKMGDPEAKLLEKTPETLERDIYLVNQWTGIAESFTVKQVLGYLGKPKNISTLNGYVQKNRYCPALKSYVFYEPPTITDIKHVLGYHILDDEVYRPIKGTPYHISQYGRLKRVNPSFEFRANFIIPSIRPKNRHENYVAANLNINGKKKLYSLANLVGMSFVINSNPRKNSYLGFKDGNTLNYVHSNLVWKDRPERNYRLSSASAIDNDTTIYLVNPITLDVLTYTVDEVVELLSTFKGPSSLGYISLLTKTRSLCKTLKCYMFIDKPTTEELKSLINLVKDDTELIEDTFENLEREIYLVNQWTGITELFTIKDVLESLDSNATITDLNNLILKNNRYCPKLNSYIFYEKPATQEIKKVLGYHLLPDEKFLQYKRTHYYISQYGRVKSYHLGLDFRADFVIPCIRPKNRNENYVAIKLILNNKRVGFPLAALVATLFVPNEDPKNDKYLCFKDGNTLNFIYSNLEWTNTPACSSDSYDINQ